MSFTKYDSLRDRTVLITGGASGIGEEYVKAFAENGAKVAFFDLNEEAGQTLTKSLAASARHAPLFLRCDVTRTDDLKAAISEVAAEARAGLRVDQQRGERPTAGLSPT